MNRAIVALAIPTILMNISIPLLGAVDTAVVGHLKEVYYLGAVSLGSLIFTMIYWAVGFFRMSTVGLAAQAHGRGDAQECMDLLGRAILLALLIGAAVIVLREGVLWVALRIFDASAEVEFYAAEYFRIRVFAAPAAFVLVVFQGWYYGLGNVAYPVAITVFVNALNVALDFLFVYGLGYQSSGVAIATVISQYLGVALTLLVFGLRYGEYWRRFSWWRLVSWPKMRIILALNRDIFIRTMGLQFTIWYFMAKSAALGDLMLAANAILLNMRYLTSYALDGFATAAEVTVGSAIGAGDRARMLAAIRISLIWGLVVGGGISLLYLAFSPWWPGWFTNNAEVLALIHTYLVWVLIEPWLSNFCYIMDGIYVGATASRQMRNSMLISALLVFWPAIEVLSWLYGNHGMWAATLLLYLARAATLTPPLRRLWRGEGVTLA